jgi:hypothetical protein
VGKTKDDEQTRRDGTDAPEPVEGKDEDTYACDASAERAWFMNLDSTLKEKPYQRN